MSSTTTIELGLDLKPPSEMVAVNIILREVSEIGDGEGREFKLEEFIRKLEEEKGKIEGLKRELPFLIPVLNDVVEGLKKELMQCRSKNASPCPILEEFMPIKSKFEEERRVKPDKDFKDKKNWMSSVQLWSGDYSSNSNNNSKKNTRERDEETEHPESQILSGECKYKVGRGAFLPFIGISGSHVGERKEKTSVQSPDLSLLYPGNSNSPNISYVPQQQPSAGFCHKGTGGGIRSSPPNAQSDLHVQQQQAQRKPRRVWSTELHRRFINALQQLGGSQVATPKQIRERMYVDGLTNDEVKSHLQKYRLHTRRPPTASTAENQQLVMLEDLWGTQDHYLVSKPDTSQSGSPQGPLQLAGSSRGVSITGGDSCGEEDEKSESYSWRGNLQRSTEEDTD